MTKGSIDFDAYRRELYNLCEKYHVLIKEERVRRENPHSSMKFYEVLLSLKTDNHIGSGWIIE